MTTSLEHTEDIVSQETDGIEESGHGTRCEETEPTLAREAGTGGAALRVGWARRGLRHWRRIAAGVALCSSAALAGALYFGQYRADQQTTAAETAAVAAATQGSVALLSYAPDSIEPDLAAAQSHLTGEFLTYYGDFAHQIVAPAAKEKAVHASATVVRAAPVAVDRAHAKVLIFLNQSTTSRDNPDPVQTASSVLVGMTKRDGRWLISSFDPI